MPSDITIDLVTHDSNTDEFVLYLVEDGPWPTEASSWSNYLVRAQKRIFDAIDVALDGHLALKYPDSKNKNVRVQIDSPHGVPSRLNELISNIKDHLKTNTDYHLAIKHSPHIKELRIVTGHEIGRFGIKAGIKEIEDQQS